MRSLALLRVLAGLVVLLHLEPFLSDSLDGRTYLDAFHEPYAAWYPEVPEAAYIGLLWLAAIAAVAMSLGLLTRVATSTTFSLVAYNLFLSTTHFHNNRAYLVLVLALLAVTPCDRELSLDSWLPRRRGAPRSSSRLPPGPCGCSASSPRHYAASGLSKLLDPDWYGGTVTWQRVVRARDDLEATPLPDWAISVLTDRGFHSGVAPMIVFTELFIAAGLWRRAAATWPVPVAVSFHVAIEYSASVQIFSLLAISVLLVWAVPSTRDRLIRIDPSDARQRRLGAVVRGLDWLARFRVEPAPPGSPLEVVDRDGSTAPRCAGRRPCAQPLAADGVVRAAHAAPPRGPQRSSAMK